MGSFLGQINTRPPSNAGAVRGLLAQIQNAQAAAADRKLLAAISSARTPDEMRTNIRAAMGENQGGGGLLRRLLNPLNPVGTYTGPSTPTQASLASMMGEDTMRYGDLTSEERRRSRLNEAGLGDERPWWAREEYANDPVAQMLRRELETKTQPPAERAEGPLVVNPGQGLVDRETGQVTVPVASPARNEGPLLVSPGQGMVDRQTGRVTIPVAAIEKATPPKDFRDYLSEMDEHKAPVPQAVIIAAGGKRYEGWFGKDYGDKEDVPWTKLSSDDRRRVARYYYAQDYPSAGQGSARAPAGAAVPNDVERAEAALQDAVDAGRITPDDYNEGVIALNNKPANAAEILRLLGPDALGPVYGPPAAAPPASGRGRRIIKGAMHGGW